MEKLTRGFLRFLLKEESINLKDLLKTNQRLLEKLGVVSQKTKILVRQIEKFGGAAKISGAGGIKDTSGILLAYHSDPEAFLGWARREGLNIFKVKLGEEGVRIEEDNI
ncbi:hypothetical protein KKD61_03135 [Patescibacteria group bacterium]|nr:hypothetical protein [Patescibacteria group bacterium]